MNSKPNENRPSNPFDRTNSILSIQSGDGLKRDQTVNSSLMGFNAGQSVHHFTTNMKAHQGQDNKVGKDQIEEEVNIHKPREYVLVNVNEKPASHSKVETFKIKWNSIDCYRVIQKVGRGKYSEVFSGLNTENQ